MCQEEMFKLIEKNPGITSKELIEKAESEDRAVFHALTKLNKNKEVIRKGKPFRYYLR